MLDKLKELIKGVMPEVDISSVTKESRLGDDLHFDSLGIMMLAMAIEDEYKIQFDDAIDFVTVGDVIAFIEQHK